MEYLSNIELYYTEPLNFSGKNGIISGDDFHHIIKVMRHLQGDKIYVTNGEGKIFKVNINSIEKNEILFRIENEYHFNNDLKNITFCIPRLKSPDRFEFAIEKSVELGITNFIVFPSARTVAKGSKKERWNKIAVSAMKQSLRCFLPKIGELKSFSELLNVNGNKIIFEQNSENRIEDIKLSAGQNYFFIFGPEGGLDEGELGSFKKEEIYNLANNRLRAETAVIKAASIIHLLF